MTQKGTPNWISPEIAQGVEYSKEVDVWAYGCFAYELLTSSPPYYKHSYKGLQMFLDVIINEDVPPLENSRYS